MSVVERSLPLPDVMHIKIASFIPLVAFMALAAGCGGSDSPSTPTSPADVTISIVGINGSSSFSPSPTTVSAGQRVSWKNIDSRVHNIVQDTPGFSTPDIAAGAAAAPVTLVTRGTFTYHCANHPSMTGSITVQ
jgi:plastocyanin